MSAARSVTATADAKLTYRWTLGVESGAGVIAAQAGTYRGNWGYGTAPTGGGTFELSKAP
jgi:hypothetical protein